MSTRIGYVLKMKGESWYTARTLGKCTPDFTAACVYEKGVYPPDIKGYGVVPVRVTEEPGPPIREIVELVAGVTIEEGMRFAVVCDRDVRSWYSAAPAMSLYPERAILFPDLESAAQLMAANSMDASRIVGIREVPGPTVRKIEEIVE